MGEIWRQISTGIAVNSGMDRSCFFDSSMGFDRTNRQSRLDVLNVIFLCFRLLVPR